MMESVPGAVATGSSTQAAEVFAGDDPVATAPGTDLIDYAEKNQTTYSEEKPKTRDP